MKNLIELALGILIVTQAYFMMPVYTPAALDWVLFVILLLIGLYIIFRSIRAS